MVSSVFVCVCGWSDLAYIEESKRPHKQRHHFSGGSSGGSGSLCALGRAWHDYRGKKTLFNLLCSVLCEMSSVLQFLCSVKGDPGSSPDLICCICCFFNIQKLNFNWTWQLVIIMHFRYKEKSSFDILFYRGKAMHIWRKMALHKWWQNWSVELAKFRHTPYLLKITAHLNLLKIHFWKLLLKLSSWAWCFCPQV